MELVTLEQAELATLRSIVEFDLRLRIWTWEGQSWRRWIARVVRGDVFWAFQAEGLKLGGVVVFTEDEIDVFGEAEAGVSRAEGAAGPVALFQSEFETKGELQIRELYELVIA